MNEVTDPGAKPQKADEYTYLIREDSHLVGLLLLLLTIPLLLSLVFVVRITFKHFCSRPVGV